MDEKLIRLQHFFEADLRIKKEMVSMAPPFDNGFLDDQSLSKYSNDAMDSLLYIFSELKCIYSDYLGIPSFIDTLIEHENIMKEHFALCGLDIHKLRSFYRDNISYMGPDFIDGVKKECVGYSFQGTSSFYKAFTVNEFLHFIHSYVVNNNNILQAIPLNNEKNNNFNYPIRFRGVNNPFFEQLFEVFPSDLDVGWTDMVAINDRRMVMMVRDRGHALTMEITLNSDIARVEYFIPKICNANMINALPGLNKKVDNESPGANGVFEVPINELSNSLFDFISKVPTDMDMERVRNF